MNAMNGVSPYDAVILAGTSKNPKRWVKGQNKSFLDLHGKPMVQYVVEQVLQCSDIQQVIVVGPREKLEFVLADLLKQHSRLRIIQQRSRMLENVWAGFLASFPDGNNLPRNQEIDTLLLGGHLPIKRASHLHIIKSVYSNVAGFMNLNNIHKLPRQVVVAMMERRFDEIRNRHERAEWFMSRIGIQTILKDGHILAESEEGIGFQTPKIYEYFLDYENRLSKRIFVTASDLPLLTSQTICNFLDACGRTQADFFFSVASEDVLRVYYKGENNSRGIIRPYLHLREAKIRSSNLILVAPNQIGNKELVQESFGIRKMTEWGNVLRLFWKLVKQKHRTRTVRLALALQATAVLNRNGFNYMAEKLRRLIRFVELEQGISRMFMTRFKLVAGPYGGVSLDVDTNEDYDVLFANQQYWLRVQDKYVKENPDKDALLFRPSDY